MTSNIHAAVRSRFSRRSVAALAGDALILLSFAAIGRTSHGDQEGGAVLGVVGTAAPFLIGWFAAAGLLGALAPTAFGSGRRAAVQAARAWSVGLPAALLLRSALEHHLTPLPFVIVAGIFNGVWLIAWHALLGRLGASPGYDSVNSRPVTP